MKMEAAHAEEEATSSKDETQLIMKGKRTKRPRPSSTAAQFSYSNEEDEAMAHCLILLAQGSSAAEESHKPPKLAVAGKSIGGGGGGGGLYGYQCKTCDRFFPSFQALGGHRASHRKPPKPTLQGDQEEKEKEKEEDYKSQQFVANDDDNSVGLMNRTENKGRTHECSMCGAEFSSGQALGGHMRRHRSSSSAMEVIKKKPRNLLSLDLNLPAPEDDLLLLLRPFGSEGQAIVFSASSLIDCHY